MRVLRKNSIFVCIAILLLAFILSVIVRLSNIERPLAKHHEFLPAVVLINAESWEQAGGGERFNYTPIMNYQNLGDRSSTNNINIDSKGNILYLSYGPGWYILPYITFKMFNLPPTALSLRILNLFISVVILILCFIFFKRVLPNQAKNKNEIATVACLILLFLPGFLWYTSNGYTHTIVTLPFLIATIIILFSMLDSAKNINTGSLVLLFFLIILNLYTDWFYLCMGTVTIVLSLFKARAEKKYISLVIVNILAIITGVAIIYWQFSSYAGWNTTLTYWRLRLLDRSAVSNSATFFTMLLFLFKHYATVYFPLFFGLFLRIVSLSSGTRFKVFSKKEIEFIVLYGVSVLLYHLILLNWSYEHEFSVLPSSILLVYIFVRYLFETTTINKLYTSKNIFCLVLISSIVQFYFINRPGKISLAGLPYDTYQILGERLRGIDPDYKIFMHMSESNPMIEFYAKRNLNAASDTNQVKQIMKDLNIKDAVWIEQQNFKLNKIFRLHRD